MLKLFNKFINYQKTKCPYYKIYHKDSGDLVCKGRQFIETDMTEGRLGKMYFDFYNMVRPILTSSYISGCSFFGVDFTGCDLSEAEIEESRFVGCRFEDSDMSETVFRRCVFENCIFESEKTDYKTWFLCSEFYHNDFKGDMLPKGWFECCIICMSSRHKYSFMHSHLDNTKVGLHVGRGDCDIPNDRFSDKYYNFNNTENTTIQ